MAQPDVVLHPLGLQEQPMLPAKVEPTSEEKSETDTVKLWEDRFKKAKSFLDPYFERDQQAFEFWYMWREFRGPYRSNIFPPDVHAGVESVVPRLTKGRPKPIVKPRPGQDPEQLIRIQRVHDAYWDKMGMDAKLETVAKRGTLFGFGVEKVTPKVTGHEEPALEEIIGQDGNPTGAYQPAKNPDGTDKTRFVVEYAGPETEICDPQRVFFSRGYATDAELPWIIFQYFKKKSELDRALYDPLLIDKLTASPNLAEDPTLERDKVHRLPRKSQLIGQTNSDNLGTAVSDFSTQEDKDDPVVELWECWERPTKDYPKGRLVTIANRKTVLRAVDNPMPKGELPSNAFRYIEDTFNYRGIGIGRQLERLVLERADKRNQRMDNVSRSIDAMTYVRKEEDVDDSDFTHRPNGIIRLGDLNSVKDRKVPDVTQNAYQEDAMLLQDEARATGANEYVMGGGKPSGKTLGEADMMSSSSNERYDGVIRRLERFLNRHAYLVHLIVQETVTEAQPMHWTDGQGRAQSLEIDPADFQAVDAEQVVYDAKSVIAYKEVSRQQGMQLLELVDKILAGDPDKLSALKPILSPLLELFDEIKVSASDLIQGIERFFQAKKQVPPPPAPPPDPTKVLVAVADIVKAAPGAVTPGQIQQALALCGIKPAVVAPTEPPVGSEMASGAPLPPDVAPAPGNPPADVVPVTDTTPDPSQIIAHATQIPNQPHP